MEWRCNKCNSQERMKNGLCKPCKMSSVKKWQTENKEKFQESVKKSHLKNRYKRNEMYKNRYKKDPEKYKQLIKEWKNNNKDKKRIYEQNRRARKKKSNGVLPTNIREKLFKLQNGKCPCCGNFLGDDSHLDHILPLALGGTNTVDNVQLLTRKCNLKKRANHPIDYMQECGFLL